MNKKLVSSVVFLIAALVGICYSCMALCMLVVMLFDLRTGLPGQESIGLYITEGFYLLLPIVALLVYKLGKAPFNKVLALIFLVSWLIGIFNMGYAIYTK